MPRIARVYTEEGVFHILARGNNKQKVFHKADDFASYKSLLQKLKEEHPFKLYHYCFMTNHIHLIVETNPKTDLSRLMKRLNLTYYNYYKNRYGYAGHFWQDRFKSLLISKDEYLIACGLYIERNPVKARMVNSPRLYAHSSYNYYAYGQKDGLLDADPVYEGLAVRERDRQLAYRNLTLDEKLNIAEKTFKQLFLGTDDFIQAMERRFGVKNTRLNIGRPRGK
jgi:putative transposase